MQAENNWEADLADLEAQIDSNTRCILVNNPSNPCGSVYSKVCLLRFENVVCFCFCFSSPRFTKNALILITLFESVLHARQEHLLDIIAIAEKHHLPIVADEIYGHLTFEGHPMFPMASLTTKVPILTAGGLAKEFIVPGWRVGWFAIHDPIGAFDELRKGMMSLTQITIGANALVIASTANIVRLM